MQVYSIHRAKGTHVAAVTACGRLNFDVLIKKFRTYAWLRLFRHHVMCDVFAGTVSADLILGDRLLTRILFIRRIMAFKIIDPKITLDLVVDDG